MNELVKQRIVGVAVLVVMMVVVMPWLLNTTSVEPAQVSELIKPVNVAQEEATPVETSALAVNEVKAESAPSLAKESSQKINLAQAAKSQDKEVVKAEVMEHVVEASAKEKEKPLEFHQQTKSNVPEAVREAAAKAVALESGQGWYGQVASFTQKENSEALMKKLEAKGLPTKLRRVASRGKRVYRVYVGPFEAREVARMNVKPLVSRHEPILIEVKG